MKSWMVTVPAGLIALIGVIADKGEKVVQVLALLTAWTANLPFGLWSFSGALALSMLVWATLIRKLPPQQCGRRLHADADFVVVVFAMALTLAQQAVTNPARGPMLMAAVIGFGAGLLAPFLCRLLERCIPRKAEKPFPEPQK